MSKVRIVADSTCDLSAQLIAENNITIIPLCIVMDGKSYYDGEDITPEEIYRWADANKTTPGTAAITFEYLEKSLRPMMEDGDEIVFIGISTDMSTTCNVIRLFAEQNDYDKVYIVDSASLSTGIGLQVLKAAEMAKEGLSGKDIADRLTEARGRVRASFIVDTLTYLARGGRCKSITAVFANALKIHPMIAVKDGAMGVEKKYRGNMNLAMERYMNDLKEELLTAEPKRVFITHSICDMELRTKAREFLESLNYFEEILDTDAGGVISSHCGPNTIGILYYVKENTK